LRERGKPNKVENRPFSWKKGGKQNPFKTKDTGGGRVTLAVALAGVKKTGPGRKREQVWVRECVKELWMRTTDNIVERKPLKGGANYRKKWGDGLVGRPPKTRKSPSTPSKKQRGDAARGLGVFPLKKKPKIVPGGKKNCLKAPYWSKYPMPEKKKSIT